MCHKEKAKKAARQAKKRLGAGGATKSVERNRGGRGKSSRGGKHKRTATEEEKKVRLKPDAR